MLKRLTISGFKSIKHVSLELGALNVLIGANGAGKSNLISSFDLLRKIGQESLQHFVGREGGANALLFCGAKRTRQIVARAEYEFGGDLYRYSAELDYAAGDTLVFKDERYEFCDNSGWHVVVVGAGHRETGLGALPLGARPLASTMQNVLTLCRVYHFHDTSRTASMRQRALIDSTGWLAGDGHKLAVLLYNLKQAAGTRARYQRIVETIRQVAPWFHGFLLEPIGPDNDQVALRWRGRDPDIEFTPHQLPDGALRAVALITLLSLPDEYLPDIIVIDEPELGLHPHAVAVVAGLLRQASHRHQIILATQSVSLLDEFDPSDVVVVERVVDQQDEEVTTFKRLETDRLKEWLEDYSVGELWEKNVFGGGPV
jgi:predicted ATPase